MNALKYNSQKNAENVITNATKIMMIVLGDDEKIWVVTPAEAAKLESQGYEILK